MWETKGTERGCVNFTELEVLLCERLEMIADIQIKVSCQKATNGWLENLITDDILVTDKMKEKVSAVKNIILKLKIIKHLNNFWKDLSYRKLWLEN